ncbi:MAG: non-ribosomal peptide synthetase, partial [Candidatus Rokuibacteriota bacterium]
MSPSPARPPERTQQLLGAYLARQTAGKRAGTIPRRAPDPHLPLSFAQEQLWLHAQAAPELPLYNEPMTVYRRGPLDVVALERSLGEILRRHEAWRTALVVQNGEPRQVVHPPAPFPLSVVDLRHLPPGEREFEALRLATMDAARPFDLERGPLFRARLVHVADDDHRLYLTLHHIIFDGVAIHRVFLPELVVLYTACAAGQPSPLPEPAVQYGDFVRWQRDSAPDPAWTPQREYWQARLAGAPAELPLPTDRPRPRVQSFRGALVRFVLPTPLSDGLRTLSRHERATLYMTLLAAFKILLHRYTGGDDIVVGSVTAGRKHPDLETVLGYFVNPVVLRTDLGGDPPFRDLLARVRETTLEALGHADVPFTHVVKALRHQRDPGRTPLLQAVISMEMPMPTLDPGWRYSQTDISSGMAKFDLDLQVEDHAEGISGRVIYPTDLFEAPTIQRLVRHYQTLLEGIVADPGRRLSDLPLMTADERHEVLVAWNATTASYPEHSTVHRLFEAQVQRSPDAVALVLDDRQLTYRQLNQRANQVAHHLQALGIGPGASVCVGMERSLELVVAVLGILKAGGGYVPLDPEHPMERLAFMVRDCGAAALVTDRQSLDRMPRDVRTVCLDAEADAIAGRSDTNLTTPVTAEHLAYAMYTSGSTGRPKGVAV